tara:strand:- start:1773 stop:2396 length:624 start_codon:yes stop_codon:yes gene_type:complete
VKGLFITFEGIDGSGKTTQINYFEKYLAEYGVDYIKTREPGGSRGAEEIRSLLVKGKTSRWSPETEILLFFASRRDHLEKTIMPALEAGKIVICDRFTDSSRVYQGLARSGIVSKVDELHKMMIELEPNLTFILDIEPRLALKRGLARNTGEDRFEDFGEEFQKKARKGFLELSEKFPTRCKVINADRDPSKISKEIINQYENLIQV